ncbi:MAG: TetR family transcriptional regulator C-terminal domain-containing protein [Chitinophagales bacterium]|nr:TetR family transcriptional regulator C-terminal domain-containing protein [Chitinophagales bacterium]
MAVKTSKPAQRTIASATELKDAFKEFILENNKRPLSVNRLMKELGAKEADFYRFYTSLDALEKDIWKQYFEETLNRLYNADAYEQYSVREKLLGMYFTFFEVLKNDRSYVTFVGKRSLLLATYLDELKKLFLEFSRKMVQEALATQEIYDRPVLSKKYNEALWAQMLFVLNFWVNDESENFEKTDEAIERAVNLSFDLMAKNPLDSLFDFGKYLFKNKFS